MRRSLQLRFVLWLSSLLVFALVVPSSPECKLKAANTVGLTANQQEMERAPDSPPNLESTGDWNRRLRERSELIDPRPTFNPRDYTIGPEDVLGINVFEAQELNREARVSAGGEISLPLLGAIRAAGLTPRELETALEQALRQKYMRDPHVSVFVREMQSHPVSVLGAVRKPGVFQVRGSKTLLEILSLAEGLADDAGETAIIMRGAGLQNNTSPDAQIVWHLREKAGDEDATAADSAKNGGSAENTVQVNLKDLLDSSDLQHNPIVSPGDIVKVQRAGIVYVVGEVQRPGGFVMKSNEKMSVLQAIALSGGLTRTASKAGASIIRTDDKSGKREQTPIDLRKILSGKAPDPMLEARDIVFVPNSAAKTNFSRGMEVATQTITGLLIFHW